MNDTVRLALTGPLGAFLLILLVGLLMGLELLTFFRDGRSRRMRAVTGGVVAVLGAALLAQLIVRLS